MKLIFKILCFTILEIIVLTSCNSKPKAEEYVFKSTKNTTDFNLFMPTGQIDICGWDKDYIEINAVTRVYSMILSDKKLIKFSHEEIEKDFNLNVLTADSLINAEIILDIKVPFLLQTINIQTKNEQSFSVKLFSERTFILILYQSSIFRIFKIYFGLIYAKNLAL